MKLMDKFHSPKIKRTPSKKGKPAEVSKTPEKPVSKEARDRFLPEGYPIPLDLEQQAVEFMSTSAVDSRSQRQKGPGSAEHKETIIKTWDLGEGNRSYLTLLRPYLALH